MFGPKHWLDAIRSVRDCICVREGCDENDFVETIYALESSLLMLDQWPEELVREVEYIVKLPELHHTAGGWRVIRVLMGEWPKIDVLHQQQLLKVLGEVFDKFDDGMGAFTISELIGEREATLDGAALLETFKVSPSAKVRSCVAHGLGDIGRKTNVESVRIRVRASLLVMKAKERDEEVKSEIEDAIRRLDKRT